MSSGGGGTLPCDLSHDVFDVTCPSPRGQTNTCENITFPKLRLWALKIWCLDLSASDQHWVGRPSVSRLILRLWSGSPYQGCDLDHYMGYNPILIFLIKWACLFGCLLRGWGGGCGVILYTLFYTQTYTIQNIHVSLCFTSRTSKMLLVELKCPIRSIRGMHVDFLLQHYVLWIICKGK